MSKNQINSYVTQIFEMDIFLIYRKAKVAIAIMWIMSKLSLCMR